MSVSCRQCPKTWPRDPALEVECPVCGAVPGEKCRTRRPSGHVHSAKFSGLPPWGHDERDLEAALAGAYGECPEGRCGLAVKAKELGVPVEALVRMKRRGLARPKKSSEAPAHQETLAL